MRSAAATRAVVLSLDAYRRLTHQGAGGLRSFLQASPWADVELDLDRARDLPRRLELDDGLSLLTDAEVEVAGGRRP